MFSMKVTALSLIQFLTHQSWDREFWEIKTKPDEIRHNLDNGSLGSMLRAQVTAQHS